MKLLIAGSRGITDYDALGFFIAGVNAVEELGITEVISGGARGVDALAEQFAAANNLPLRVMKADWSKGIHAGLERNTEMVDACDGCVVLWDGSSRGTQDTVRKVMAAGKPLWLFTLRQVNEGP